MQRSGRLLLSEVNQHLVCALCGGYLIDATTIVECLHSFCRSCLIKYLECNSFCPICDVQIHKAKPFLNIKPDKALQDIVYKLVPGLFHSEMRRRQEFYAKHPERMYETTPEGRGVGVERLIYSPDDSISLSLEYLDGEEEAGCASNHSSESETEGGVNKRYLQCPALVTIGHLKKFLRIKYELASVHTVEIIHRRESLPDDYTLMDVAYIYTWKRNGPMRFFFRITQSTPESQLQQQILISDIKIAMKDSSESSVAVPRCTPKSDINDDHDNPKVLPPAEAQKTISSLIAPNPELPRDSSTETTSKNLPITVSESHPAPAVITKSMESIPVPATTTSVSPAITTSAAAPSSQSLHMNSQISSSVSVTRMSSHPSSIALTKTTTVTKTMPSSDVSNASLLNFDLNVCKVTTQSIDTITKSPVQVSKINNGILPQKSTLVTISKSSTKDTSTLNTQQPNSIPATSELVLPSSTTICQVSSPSASKEIAQKAKIQKSHQMSVSDIPQMTGQIWSGIPKTEKEPQSPLNTPSPELNKCKTQSHQANPPVVCKTEPEENTSSNNKATVLNEDVKNISIQNPTSGSSITTKAVLSKYVQQRLNSSNRKISHPMKVTPEANGTKGLPYVPKIDPQHTKESNKLHINAKLTDKPTTTSDNLIPKKESSQVKSNATEKIETCSKESNSQKEMANADNIIHTPVNKVNNSTNNNNTKVPQQNQQIIRNNQQILKKNDEIMRCVPIKRPIPPVSRKTQDVLKNSTQHRDIDDKANAKKRRITLMNPIKRPAMNSLEVAKGDQAQPLSKKSRPTVENNRKPLQSDQKASTLKVRFSNPVTGQNPLSSAGKSESNMEIATSTLKNNGSNNLNVSHSLGSAELKSREIKNQENMKNHIISERIQTSNVQRPPSTSQSSTVSKLSITSTSPSAIKKEPHSTKSEITPPPMRGTPNMISPPAPAVAHTNANPRHCPTPLPPSFKGKTGLEPDGTGALDLSASPRRQTHPGILSIAQTLARRQQQQHCPSPAPPPLSPLSSLSPFPVIPGVPVRSPPPQLRIPVPSHHRSGHSQQQRPSSLSSSSPSPPADNVASSSRMGPPQQQQPHPIPPEMYPPHLMSPASIMIRQQLELQRLLGAGKHNSTPGMEWYNDPNSLKRFENLMKSLHQQQNPGRNSPFYPFNNNNSTAAATNNHRK